MDNLSKLLKEFSDKSQNKLPKINKRISSSILSHDLMKINNILENDYFISFCNHHDSNISYAFEESKDFISSLITLTNWYDDMKNGGATGLLIKVTTDNLIKIGIKREFRIESITTTFMPIVEYIESMINYFDEKPPSDYGNLNAKNVITGNVIGNGNIVIPLYINKYHWDIAKILMKPMLGLSLSHNPFTYLKNYDSLVFSIYSEMLRLTLVDNKFKLNDKWIKTLFIFSRTTAQLCFDNKYNRGIKNHVSKYITEPKFRINNLIYDYSNIIGQSISTGYLFDNNEHIYLTRYYLEELITSIINPKKYNKKFVLNLQLSPENINTEIINCINLIESSIQRQLQLCMTLILSVKIFKQFYSNFGTYSSYIKYIDNNYSIMDESVIKIFNDIALKFHIDIDNVSIKYLYELMGCDAYYINELTLWIIQSSLRSKDKYRLTAIDENKYHDSVKNPLNVTQSEILNILI